MTEAKEKKPNAWLIALRKWNEGKGSWAMPKKGSKEYEEVRGLMGKGETPKDVPKEAPKETPKEAPKAKTGRLRVAPPAPSTSTPIPGVVAPAPVRTKKSTAAPVAVAPPPSPVPVAPVAPKKVRMTVEKKNVVLA